MAISKNEEICSLEKPDQSIKQYKVTVSASKLSMLIHNLAINVNKQKENMLGGLDSRNKRFVLLVCPTGAPTIIFSNCMEVGLTIINHYCHDTCSSHID